MICGDKLLADYFDQHTFRPPPIELTVEDLLPRSKIKTAVRDGHDNFTAHDLSFVMCIGVVFARAVVGVTLRRRVKRCEFLEPAFQQLDLDPQGLVARAV